MSMNNIQLSGDTFEYEASVYPQDDGSLQNSLVDDPCPEGVASGVNPTTGEPLCPPPNPALSPYIPAVSDESIPDFVPIIRALSEAWYFAKKALDNTITIPSRTVVVDFYEMADPDPILRTSSVNNTPQFVSLLEAGYVPVKNGSQSVKPSSPYTEAALNFYYIYFQIF